MKTAVVGEAVAVVMVGLIAGTVEWRVEGLAVAVAVVVEVKGSREVGRGRVVLLA